MLFLTGRSIERDIDRRSDVPAVRAGSRQYAQQRRRQHQADHRRARQSDRGKTVQGLAINISSFTHVAS